MAGITVVVVTHEAEVAAHARRILRFRDGKVIADEPSPTTKSTVDVAD